MFPWRETEKPGCTQQWHNKHLWLEEWICKGEGNHRLGCMSLYSGGQERKTEDLGRWVRETRTQSAGNNKNKGKKWMQCVVEEKETKMKEYTCIYYNVYIHQWILNQRRKVWKDRQEGKRKEHSHSKMKREGWGALKGAEMVQQDRWAGIRREEFTGHQNARGIAM